MTNSNRPAVIDAQVHAYERDHPQRPWIGTLHGPPEVTGDDMVAAMDAVGVDGAILVSPWSMYRFDASYALEVAAKHPDRFGLVKPFDPNAADVAEQIEEWARFEASVGARLMLGNPASANVDMAGVDRVLRATGALDLPVNVLCWGDPALLANLATRHPSCRFVLDHLGLKQPFEPPPPAEPFADLPAVLELASFDNVVIKITGACTLSHQPFPFTDIWPPLGEIFEAFGMERCLWGTDWTRAVALLSYAEGVDAFRVEGRLTEAERGMLMGGNAARVYGFTPGVT